MPKTATSFWSLVLIPAILTLTVTILRLVGELQGWNPTWFGTGIGDKLPNGESDTPGMFGIAFLVPIFGLYFGFRLRRAQGSPGIGRVIGLNLLGIAIMAGGVFVLYKMELVTFPSAEKPGEPQGLLYAAGALLVGLIVSFIAWGKLAGTLLGYGLLARIPVVIVTYLAVTYDWDTHYSKMPQGMPAKAGMDKVMMLATPQLTVWIAFTILIGGLFGGIGAAMAGDKSKG